MKRYKCWHLAVLLLLVLSSCQKETGIRFEESKSFSELFRMAEASSKEVFLLVWKTDEPIGETLKKEVLSRQEAGDFFNAHFINAAVRADDSTYSADLSPYGLDEYPALLFLSPRGELIHEVVSLGQIGVLEDGSCPSLKPLFRQATMACRYLNDSDSAFFSADNWTILDEYFLRLDSKVFERVVANKALIKERYDMGYDMLVDFCMSYAAVNLVRRLGVGKSERMEKRIQRYYTALEKLPIDRKDLYKLYADVNISYATGDIETYRKVITEAYRKGLIPEHEWHRLSSVLPEYQHEHN